METHQVETWLDNTGAGDEIRTRDQELGKLLLYQLSYARLMP
jgi:hypothetical protein